MIFNNVLETIGNTPLIKLNKIKARFALPFDLYAKFERTNPSGSIKDRAAYYIIKDALDNKKINKDTVIIEATSGNTGISLAMIGAYLGLKVIICMPENASKERILMMIAYGAQVELTPKEKGMKGSVEKSNELATLYPNHFMASQFDNPSNIKAHVLGTGPEIYRDLAGDIDVFLAGFGTGGTLSGVSRYLKSQNKNIECIGVEPLSSPLINENKAGPHKIQGIGANFVPSNLDTSIIDRVIDVSNEDAYEGTRLLAQEEGLFCGISSGAALMGALKLDNKKYAGKTVVVVLPDNGERYLSVEGLYERNSK